MSESGGPLCGRIGFLQGLSVLINEPKLAHRFGRAVAIQPAQHGPFAVPIEGNPRRGWLQPEIGILRGVEMIPTGPFILPVVRVPVGGSRDAGGAGEIERIGQRVADVAELQLILGEPEVNSLDKDRLRLTGVGIILLIC